MFNFNFKKAVLLAVVLFASNITSPMNLRNEPEVIRPSAQDLVPSPFIEEVKRRVNSRDFGEVRNLLYNGCYDSAGKRKSNNATSIIFRSHGALKRRLKAYFQADGHCRLLHKVICSMGYREKEDRSGKRRKMKAGLGLIVFLLDKLEVGVNEREKVGGESKQRTPLLVLTRVIKGTPLSETPDPRRVALKDAYNILIILLNRGADISLKPRFPFSYKLSSKNALGYLLSNFCMNNRRNIGTFTEVDNGQSIKLIVCNI